MGYSYSHSYVSIAIAGVSIVLFLFCMAFFRSPRRTYAGDHNQIVVAPADGTIVAIEEVEECEYFGEKRLQVSIFMTVFNVHANWYPVDGTVTHSSHQNGRFMAAYLPKSSTENERSTVAIRTPQGIEIMMRQIAGALARRIVTYSKEGDSAEIGKQMGFIKFGSRVDIYLPVDTEMLVALGDKTKGNITPIARLKA